MQTKWLVVGIFGIALISAVGWRYVVKKNQAAELDRAQQARKTAPTNVTFADAGPKDIVQTVDLVASLESPYDVKVSSKVSARIGFLDVREGESVKPGQVLVRLDASDLQASVYQMEASLAEAKSKLAQAKFGQGGNDVSVVANVQQQDAAVSSALADLDQARQSQAARAQAQDAMVTDARGRLRSAKAQESSAKADMETARANMANAETRLNRIMSLYKQGFTAAQDVDDAKTAYQVTVNALKGAQEKVNAAHSSVESAEAQLDAATQQAIFNKRKDASDVTAAKARYTQARAGRNVAGANQSQKQAYQENIAALKATVAAAAAQLRQSQAHLSDTVLTSSIDGTVTSRLLDPGTVASPGQTILEIQYLKWLYAVASVPLESGAGVHLGQEATLVFDGIPDKSFKATIALLNPAADPQSRQFKIQLKLDNPNGELRPGMYGRISIPVKVTHAAVTVPREALHDKSVYVVDSEGVLHQRAVEVGMSDAATIEITKGLEAGERVVVLSYQALKDGQKVRLPKGDSRR